MTRIASPDLVNISRIIFALTVYHHVLVASLKTSAFDNFALERHIPEAFAKQILRCLSLSVSGISRDRYHHGLSVRG
jgi:hypothetical protein